MYNHMKPNYNYKKFAFKGITEKDKRSKAI